MTIGRELSEIINVLLPRAERELACLTEDYAMGVREYGRMPAVEEVILTAKDLNLLVRRLIR